MAITFSTAMADLGKVFAAFVNLNGLAGNQAVGSSAGSYYVFTVSAAAATAAATYTNNGQTFTVVNTIAAGTVLLCTGTGLPAASGTLTKTSGTGDATITFSAFVAPSLWGTLGPVIKSQSTMYSDVLTREQATALAPLPGTSALLPAILALDSALDTAKSGAITDAGSILITRVNNDVVQVDPTSLELAMIEWIRQMQSGSQSVKACTVSSTVTAGASNTGTATVYASIYDPNGKVLENAYAETLVLRCTEDQYHGAEAGSETISITSPSTAHATTSYRWYQNGSGLNTSLTVTDPEQGNGSGQNLLTGSLTATDVGAFKAFSGAVPVAWTVDVDGANVADGTTNKYAGDDHCLKFIGNTGSTNAQTAIYQNFANAISGAAVTGGSTQELLPATVYLFCIRVKASVVPAAGVVSFSLTDSSGTVINDNAGTANTIATTVSGYGSTAYQTVTGAFRTPTVMPTGVRLRIKATTPITTGTNVFMDYAALTQAESTGPVQPGGGGESSTYGGLYNGGPYLAIFRGNVDCVNWVSPTIGDTWSDAIANNFGSSSPTPLSLQTLFGIFFGMTSLGLVLPSVSDGSETLSNQLIQ